MFETINQLFNSYFEKSQLMIEKKMPWAVVLSFHEVYRHLYPTEPYIKNYSILDEEKPAYILKVLENQLNMYNALESGIIPYENNDLANLKHSLNTQIVSTVEKNTHVLYGNLWEKLTIEDVVEEPKKLLEKRLNSKHFSFSELKNKTILDMGCGSGRYTIALSSYGCKSVIGFDMGQQGIDVGIQTAHKLNIENVIFKKGNVLELPFEDNSFDFIFCNGVLHHTIDMERGIQELFRVLKPSCKAFLYLYASKGLFWTFRKKARQIIEKIPREYAQRVLDLIGLPSNRFIFMDTWYVPIERHSSRDELEKILLNKIKFSSIEKLISKVETDLDNYLDAKRPYAEELFGDGEHRYILVK